MSRSAAALDYQDALAAELARGRRHRSPGARLLGDPERVLDARPSRQQTAVATRQVRRPRHQTKGPEPGYQVWVWHPAVAQEERLELTTREWSIKHPQWLVITLLSLAALIAVSPVFASSGNSGVTRRPAAQATSNPGNTPQSVPDDKAAPAAKAAQPKPQSPQGNYEVLGPPSISVKQIEAVLLEYSSPAVGHGQSIFDLGIRFGIDPIYALAFFVHESGCGTRGVARFTHSLGNIRWTSGYDNYEGYRSYSTWEAGMEDWYTLISDLYIGGWNLRTVDAIVPVYAPYGDDNNPPVYIAAVKSMVDSWRGK